MGKRMQFPYLSRRRRRQPSPFRMSPELRLHSFIVALAALTGDACHFGLISLAVMLEPQLLVGELCRRMVGG